MKMNCTLILYLSKPRAKRLYFTLWTYSRIMKKIRLFTNIYTSKFILGHILNKGLMYIIGIRYKIRGGEENMRYIDFRSDTVTMPTEEMRKAMYEAPVGDDVYMDDPTVNKLEKLAAEMTGKEAALFVTSGTMGNQISIMSHTRMGDEIIVSESSHIRKYEVGAAARLSGVNFAIVNNPNHRITKKDVLSKTRGVDIHFPETSLVCIENSIGADGTVMSLEEMKEIYETAKENNLAVHLDGARIFNASTYLNVEVKEMTKYADSITFCLSKGLCSPIGSLLCGSQEFINRARKMRKILGGGMRQAGILAACGIISIEKMIERLEEDHDNARYMAEELNKIDGFYVDMENLQTNLIFCKISRKDFNSDELKLNLFGKGVKIGGYDSENIRFATHNDINREDIDYTIKLMKEMI